MPGRHLRASIPEFEPGTHLALINYGTERLHAIRHSDNPNSFERVLDTRLFRPSRPCGCENHLMQGSCPHASRARTPLRGQPPARPAGRHLRRCRSGSATARISCRSRSTSSRRREHPRMAQTRLARRRTSSLTVTAVMFTSNGQVHHHWTPVDFRERTKLRQLSEHVLVVVETDPLPIAGSDRLLHRGSFRRARERGGASSRERACRLPRRLGRAARVERRADP